MAITYNRNEKCGRAIFSRTTETGSICYSTDLYVGNTFLMMVSSDENEDKLHSFFVDADHMIRCMKNNIYKGIDTLVTIEINKAKCRNWKAVVAIIAEYMDDVNIKTYTDGDYIWKQFLTPAEAIPDTRMRELAETAISYINDNDMISDFCEDRGIEFTDEEKSYFCIYDEEDE